MAFTDIDYASPSVYSTDLIEAVLSLGNYIEYNVIFLPYIRQYHTCMDSISNFPDITNVTMNYAYIAHM